MYEEIKIDGHKYQRYQMVLVEHALDGDEPRMWDLCIADLSDQGFIYHIQVTGAQAKGIHKPGRPTIFYSRETDGWAMMRQKVDEYIQHAILAGMRGAFENVPIPQYPSSMFTE